MIRPGSKTLLPLFVLLVAAGGLLAAWWFGADSASDPNGNRQNRNHKLKVTSGHVLSELAALRDAKTPREFTAIAGEMIRKDETLRADELAKLGDELFHAGFVQTAELCFRKTHSLGISDDAVTLKLARLLYATGRISEARRQMTGLLQSGGIDLLSLPMLGNAELTWNEEVEAIQSHRCEIADLTTVLSQAWIALQKQDIGRAMSLLDVAIQLPAAEDNPQLFRLRAQTLRRSGKIDELAELLAGASLELRTSSDEMLCLQGQLCQERNQDPAAIRCFWEAFRLHPNSYFACSQLAELLEMKQLSDVAAILRERSLAIRDYEDICRQIYSSEFPTEQQLGVAANAGVKLHCLRETVAWCEIAALAYPDATWPQTQKATIQTGIFPTDQRFSQLHNWIASQNFSSYPLPDWPQLTSRIPRENSSGGAPIVFQDDTEVSGIQFQFEDAAVAGSDITRLFEFTGGGVTVLDVDLDGGPDVFFTQGGTAPSLGATQPQTGTNPEASPTDQLFRNVRGQSFRQATDSAKLMDGGYSQGCTSGDFDMDGFPDLYVANIGQNQLFRNNGDGTLSVVTLPSSETWTTSCAIADLTGDGVPDIYDVNHVIAAGVHQRMCRKAGVSVPCTGGEGLVAEQDRLFAGNGDGSFTNITDRAGIPAKDGLGLGLVVFRLGDEDGLSVFVANDARPNFLFVNQGNSDVKRGAGQPQFSDEAVLRGVAFSGTGRAQACMGVAAGDADGDGTTDLFVTNFFADYNTMYRQKMGFFHDSSENANLVQGSYDKLGFGTQFLDADLDGDEDLVVTNGDVVDFSRENSTRPYAQPPQLFRNLSNGTFEEQSADMSGSAFHTSRLGRGLARLDWNADGRPDFVVSHIRAPALLATNQTTDTGHYLSLRLVGTQSPRHPVGSIVCVTTTKGQVYRQLTVGDGYQACNENVMLLGLGSQEQAVTVTIKWPSGNEQSLSSIPVDSSIIVVELQISKQATFGVR